MSARTLLLRTGQTNRRRRLPWTNNNYIQLPNRTRKIAGNRSPSSTNNRMHIRKNNVKQMKNARCHYSGRGAVPAVVVLTRLVSPHTSLVYMCTRGILRSKHLYLYTPFNKFCPKVALSQTFDKGLAPVEKSEFGVRGDSCRPEPKVWIAQFHTYHTTRVNYQ